MKLVLHAVSLACVLIALTASARAGAGNNAPVANSDDVVLAPSTAPNVLDVRGNDTDADNDVITITDVTQGQFGTVTTDGASATYTARPGFPGADTFTYFITDFHGGTDTGTVTVTGEPIASGATLVIKSGDTPPGLARGSILTLGVPAVNRTGVVAFTAHIASGSVTLLDRNGIFTSTDSVAQQFDPAPDYDAGVTTDAFTDGFESPLINDAGDVTFIAKIRPQPSGTLRALFIRQGAATFRIMAEKQFLPGTGVLVTKIYNYALLDDGSVIVFATTKQFASTLGVWRWDAAHGVRLVANSGDSINIAPAGMPDSFLPLTTIYPSVSVSGSNGHGRWNAPGRFLIHARSIIAPKVAIEVLVDLLAPQGTQLILRSDTPAADIAGTKFSSFIYPTWSDPANGGIALRALRSPVLPNKLPKASYLILDSLDGAIARVGDAAVGVAGGNYTKFGYPVGGGDKLAFTGTLGTTKAVVPNIAESNNTGLWQRIGGTLQLVAREGAQVDHGGSLSPYIKAFSRISMPDDRGVGVLFTGVLKNPPLAAIANRVTAKNDEVVYVADASGKPTLLIREGLPLPAFPELGPVLEFAGLGDEVGGNPAVARSYSGDRFAARLKTLPPGESFSRQAIVVFPLK